MVPDAGPCAAGRGLLALPWEESFRGIAWLFYTSSPALGFRLPASARIPTRSRGQQSRLDLEYGSAAVVTDIAIVLVTAQRGGHEEVAGGVANEGADGPASVCSHWAVQVGE